MAKSISDRVLDGALNIIKNNCTRMIACSAEPTNFTQANSTYALADQTMASTDYTVANGDTSGRKVTAAAKTGIPVDVTGTVNHVAHVDVAGSSLEFVTTTASQAVGAGGTLDIGAHKFEIGDPA